jgi:MFS family permease
MTSAARTADAQRRTPAHGWWPLLVISSAQLMAILDTTIMFVALPSAQQAVGLSVAARQWIITAYTLAFAALLLVGGRLADRLAPGAPCWPASSASRWPLPPVAPPLPVPCLSRLVPCRARPRLCWCRPPSHCS